MRRVLVGIAMVLGCALLLGCGTGEPGTAVPTLTVRPGGSIQAALDAAPAGGVIRLPRGTWTENLRITKPVVLRGEGPERTIIQAGRPGLAVVWVGEEAQVAMEGLTLQGGRGGYIGPEASSAGVFVAQDAVLELRQVKITRNAASGVFARDRARVHLSAVEIGENARYGVEAIGQAQVVLEGSALSRNGMGGLWAAEEAYVEAATTAVEGNLGPGFWVRDGATVRLWSCEVWENAGPGLRLQDGAVGYILASRVFAHRNAGLELLPEARAHGYGAVFQENGYGLELKGGAAFLEGCHVLDVRWDGIYAAGTSHLSVTASHIAGGTGSGVMASGSARVILKGNTIRDFPGAGVAGFSRAPVEGEDNAIAETGVALMGNVQPALRARAFSPHLESVSFPDPRFPDLQSALDALLPGGVVELGPGLHLGGVTVEKPVEIRSQGEAVLYGASPTAPVLSLVAGAALRLVGVWVTGGAEGLAGGAGTSAELWDCVFSENSVGIRLWYDARLSARRVNVSRHAQGGIWLWDESEAFLEELTVQKNDVCGIGAGGRSSLHLQRSLVVENGWQGGVLLREAVRAELWENVFAGNRGHGVAAQSPACVGAGPGLRGEVRGGRNEFAENYKGPVCPTELIFLAR